MFSKVVCHFPEKIFGHIAERVCLSWQQDKIESFVCFDEGVHHSDGVGRVNIVIYIAGNNKELFFKVFGKLTVFVDVIDKGSISFFCYLLLYAMVSFRPPTVVYVVFMVSSTRYCYFEEIGIYQHSGGGHKPSSGMSGDTYPVDVNERISICQLFCGHFFVFQAIVTKVSIAVGMIPFRTSGMATTVTYGNHNEAHLCQTIQAVHASSETFVYRFCLWSWIHIFYQWVCLCRVEVERFVHHPIKVCDAVPGFYFERFRELISCCEELA